MFSSWHTKCKHAAFRHPTTMKRTFFGLACTALLAAATTQAAVSVPWNLDLYPATVLLPSADSIAASANSGVANLSLGPNLISGFTAFTYQFGNSGDLNLDIPFTLSRNLTVGGVSLPLNQPGDVFVTFTSDSFIVNVGTALASYDLGNGYAVDVTVNGDSFTGTFIGQTVTRPVNATFTLVAVPEPGSILLGILGGGSLLFSNWRRRKEAH